VDVSKSLSRDPQKKNLSKNHGTPRPLREPALMKLETRGPIHRGLSPGPPGRELLESSYVHLDYEI
jgi:hypothetical protein